MINQNVPSTTGTNFNPIILRYLTINAYLFASTIHLSGIINHRYPRPECINIDRTENQFQLPRSINAIYIFAMMTIPSSTLEVRGRPNRDSSHLLVRRQALYPRCRPNNICVLFRLDSCIVIDHIIQFGHQPLNRAKIGTPNDVVQTNLIN